MNMEEYVRVAAKISLDAIEENIQSMKQNLKPETKIMAVVKTDAYGHGALAIADDLEKKNLVYGFCVATAEEAMVLRKAGIQKPILTMGFTYPYSYRNMIEQNITMTVFQEETLDALSKTARLLGKKACVHIKVDTGMSRIGINPDEEGKRFARSAIENPDLLVEGIFTHFANADVSDKSEAKEQLFEFIQMIKEIEEENSFHFKLKHCSNSAGILEMPEANMDLVRAGIALYGLWPSEEMDRNQNNLFPALSLISHVIYVKNLVKGRKVSYNGTFTAPADMIIATVPVGYGDGYPRSLSNKGCVLIRGKRCPIVGKICMDQMMVDVSALEEVKEMDTVTLIGRDGDEFLSAEEVGGLSGRFPYELVCCLGKRIPRAYYMKGKSVAGKDYYDDYSFRRF